MKDKLSKANSKNINVSILKLVAACAVVFLHARFKDPLGLAVDCVARFAVPVFFAISGYYSYQISTERIQKRLKRIIIILVVSNLLYLIWDLYYKCYVGNTAVTDYLKGVFGVKKLAFVFLMDGALTSFHLWYLTAITFVYIAYLAYCSFWKNDRVNYNYLYYYSVIGFVVLVLFALKAQAVNIGEYHWIYRNGLFMGIPFFSMGLFIHEYRERIMDSFFFENKKITIMLFVASVLLSLLQYFGIGATDFPIMLTYAIFVLILFSTGSENRKKNMSSDALCKLMGRMSLIIYIIHVLIRDIFRADHDHKKMFGEISQNGYVFPFVVLGVSIVISFIVSIFMGYIDDISDKKKSK